MSRSDLALLWSLRLCAFLSSILIFLIFYFLISESFPALLQVGGNSFLTDPSWHPTEGFFNMMPMIAGTLCATLGAILLASPVGVVSAIFCRYVAPAKIGRLYRRLIELMAGIPSVVYGFWGLVTLVPLVNQISPPGQSLLSGILVLALMILPTITLIVEASLSNVPFEYWQAAKALGLSRWTTIYHVVFPVCKSGISTAILLATGRAIGETMAILMVCGNVVKIPQSLFDPVRTLTSNIALEMAYAMDLHRSALFVGGLLLTVMVVCLVWVAEIISRKNVHV